MNLMTRTRIGLTLLAVLAFALCTTACNTMEGAGKDVEDAGQAVQDAAD